MSSSTTSESITYKSAEDCLLAAETDASLLVQLGRASFIALQCAECNASVLVSAIEDDDPALDGQARITVVSGSCQTSS